MPLHTPSIPSDAIERIDADDNEVIMMDPRNYYMIYLLRASAFLHSSIAFLMMISYYKLKVVTDFRRRASGRMCLCSGAPGHLQA